MRQFSRFGRLMHLVVMSLPFFSFSFTDAGVLGSRWSRMNGFSSLEVMSSSNRRTESRLGSVGKAQHANFLAPVLRSWPRLAAI